MAGKRSYGDGCAAAHALDLVGERWALLVVRELVLGPKRFTDLRAGLPAISPNVLSQRLDELEQIAVVQRRKLPPPFGSWVYELTDWGRELEPVVIQLGRWGARSPFMDREAPISPDTLAMSLKSMFSPRAAEGVTKRYEVRLGEYRFRVDVHDGRIEVARGGADHPDAIIDSDPGTLGAVIYDGRDLDEAVRAGALKIDGDKEAVKVFLTLFSLPEKAPGPVA
jgi:DNA-binding HxlR family transcriptional regulator